METAAGVGAAGPPQLANVDDFSCPICLDLLYKPCANSCGHAFCFWCQHHAMSPFRPSKCPLCRSAYTHFPRVCLPLHRFLEAAFPEQYAERERENRALEAKQGVESPDIPPATAQQPQAQAAGAGEEAPASEVGGTYRCCRPGCGRLACQPCVLSCGCVVCSPSCMPVAPAQSPAQPVPAAQQAAGDAAGGGAGSQPSAPSPAGEAKAEAGAEAQLQAERSEEGAGPSAASEAEAQAAGAAVAGAWSEEPSVGAPAAVRPLGSRPATPPGQSHLPRCPGCNAAVLPNPQVCIKLEEALRRLFPHQYREREAEVARERARREEEAAAAAGANSSGGGGAVGGAQEAAGGGRGGRVRPRSKLPRIDAMIEAAAAASVAADEAAVTPGAERPPPPPSTLDIWSALRDELAANSDAVFTWYSVGCDDCGVFPIVGRRYRCRDCPEAIGFDLCGACHDRGTAGRGRFNQAHRPGHRMRKVDPNFGLVSRRRRRQQLLQRAAEGAADGAAADRVAAAPADAAAAAAAGDDEEEGDEDGSDPLGQDGIQVLTLMNYMEVLHPELTVEQATSLVLMHLGLGGGGLTDMFDLAGGGGGGGGGGGANGGAEGGGGAAGPQQGQAQQGQQGEQGMGHAAGVRVPARGGVLQPPVGAGAARGSGGGGSGWSGVRSWFGSLVQRNSGGGGSGAAGGGAAGGAAAGSGLGRMAGGGAARQAAFSSPTRGGSGSGGGGGGGGGSDGQQGANGRRGEQEGGGGSSSCVLQ